MPVTTGHSNQAPEDPRGEPSTLDTQGADVPAWLVTRRARVSASSSAPAPSNSLPSIPGTPHLPLTKPKTPLPSFAVLTGAKEKETPPQDRLNEWFSKQGMIGVAVSLLVHTLVLLILAFLLVSQVSREEISTIFGMQGNSDELTADLILDSELPGDQGESAPLETTDVSQKLDALGVQSDFAESMHVGLGGKGTGDGDSGDGSGLGVGALKVPGHAQTKGSFSTWSDPRDPKPGQDYDIVIQVKLPGNVTKFRGSDISGNVIGTDGYRQTIRFKPNEILPIEGGIIRIRIPVPGAGRLVRDTIRVESKLLKERQTFEIEF